MNTFFTCYGKLRIYQITGLSVLGEMYDEYFPTNKLPEQETPRVPSSTLLYLVTFIYRDASTQVCRVGEGVHS